MHALFYKKRSIQLRAAPLSSVPFQIITFLLASSRLQQKAGTATFISHSVLRYPQKEIQAKAPKGYEGVSIYTSNLVVRLYPTLFSKQFPEGAWPCTLTGHRNRH